MDFLLHLVTRRTCSYSIALVSGSILAFDHNFIEVRDLSSGVLLQIIPMVNMRALNLSADKLFIVTDGSIEHQHIYKLTEI